MSGFIFHPLGIYVFGLGGGFLLPVLYQVGKRWLNWGFVAAMLAMTLCAVVPAIEVLSSGRVIEIATAGSLPPISINLRFGPWEAAVSATATLTAFLLAIALWPDLKGRYVPLLLFLITTMGVNGLIQTRDLFNLFVFLEILSVGTYGLLALSVHRAGVQAAFKYVSVTMVASVLVLLGAVLLYETTGQLNIDLLIEAAPKLGFGFSGIALAMLLAGLLIELKSYPAGGWGLDVYETAPQPLAAFISVVASAGLIFATGKLLPLFDGAYELLIWSATITFVASNLAGLRQTSVSRLLGYSSIGQIGLLLLAMVFLTKIGATDVMPFVLFGLFVNHLLAKAGLFCFARLMNARSVEQPLGLASRPAYLVLLGIFICAISGLPPFPGFWAKWELIMQFAEARRYELVGLVLLGSLCEAAYIFRWFFNTLENTNTRAEDVSLLAGQAPWETRVPVFAFAVLLVIGGVAGAWISGEFTTALVLPLIAGALVYAVEPVSARAKAILTLGALIAAYFLLPRAMGIAGLFSLTLLTGSVLIAISGIAFTGPRRGHYPLVAILLVSIQSLFVASTGLAFYAVWEFVTLACTFLIARQSAARDEAMRFFLFSLAAAFFLIAGFAIVAAEAGTRSIDAVMELDPYGNIGVALLAVGFLIKAAAIGVHVWLPGAYAAADDDVTALLSAVVSKTAMFGLLITCYFVLRGNIEIDFGYWLAWIGMATVVSGAVMALQERDLKRLLAYSSMSQLGYIVVAIGLMGHLGWVTAFYLVASHMFVKGILFLALAGIKQRTGAAKIGELGGLLAVMPITALLVGVALLSMSGVPPLMGFGAKWLLFSALIDKGWHGIALAGGLATFLGFWYMARFYTSIFLSRPQTKQTVKEAPFFIVLPQVLLVGGIVVLSLFPKVLMAPVSAAIDRDFAASLVWQGQALETIYGLWDPSPVMLSMVSIAVILGMTWWLASRLGRDGLSASTSFLTGAPLPPALLRPVALGFWRGFSARTNRLSDIVRSIYTGSAQDYVLQAVLFFLVLFCLMSVPERI